ncbi:MAG TPA: hypothetical protein VJ476_07965 [Rhizomicrobium sp.]|nr:hypothetical protein [Rhizomicrobium sp.]
MRGALLVMLAASLLLAACSSTPKPRWSPFEKPRSEEWHSGRMMIENFDLDGTGTVTREQLEAGLRQYFRQADTNHDGVLEPDEIAAENQRRIKRDGSAAIPLIDWDHKGYVTFDDFASALRSQFEQMDLNGDGKVTIDEFRHAPP